METTTSKPVDYYAGERPDIMPFIPLCKRYLDVGCGEGRFGKILKDVNSAEVWGCEIDENAGIVAKANLSKALIGDFEMLIDTLPDAYFDCAIFNDALEHFKDPSKVLKKLKTKLTAEGVVVCSLPNVLHFKILKMLIFDKDWRYESCGIMDKTHLRFFTKKSVIDMFTQAGYAVTQIKGIHLSKKFAYQLLNLITFGFFKDSFNMQIVCAAKPKR